MTALRRVVAVIGASAVVALCGPVAAMAAPAMAPQVQDRTTAGTRPGQAPEPAVQSYAGCLQGQRGGDILLLIDESGSLAQTDPGAARVQAAGYLLDQLRELTGRAGIEIDVAVAGFAENFELTSDWTPLTGETLPHLRGDVASYAGRNRGFDTDYWLALQGVRETLKDRPPTSTGANRCQAVAWFTDGMIDIEPRDSDAEKAEHGTTKPYSDDLQITSQQAADDAARSAADQICAGGGLADQLRSTNVATFAVGLAPPGHQPPDFALLTSIAAGRSAAGATCGTDIDPQPGTFHLATDLDDLYFALDGIIPPDRTGSGQICPPDDLQPCADRHEFVLDDSIDGVHVLASADRPNVEVQLARPDGTVVRLDPTPDNQPRRIDASLSYAWQSTRTVAIDLDDKSGSAPQWTGVWGLLFLDPQAAAAGGASRSNIHIWGELVPAWVNRADVPLHSGSPVPDVRLGLTGTNGAPVDPASLRGSVSLSAAIVEQNGRSTPVAGDLGKNDLGTPVELDLRSVAPGPAVLRLTLELTTAPAVRPGGAQVPGTPLVPQQVDVPLKVETPVGYPTLGGRIDFGTADGTTELAAVLPVTGPGCVWVDGAPATDTAPADVAVQVTADGAASGPTCLVVEEGAKGELPLRLAADRAGNGTASGTIPVSISPIGELDKTQTVAVAYTADLRKPFRTSNALLILLAAVLLGPGIPLGLLYLVKWFTARIPERGLCGRRMHVVLENDRVLRDGQPFHLRPDDFVQLLSIPHGGARRIEADGVVLRTRIGWSPFGAGHVVVEVPGYVAGSSTDPHPHGPRCAAHLPLAVHNTWVLLHDPNGPPNRAEVLILMGSETTQSHRDDLAADLVGQVPDMLRALRVVAAESRPAPDGAGPPAGSGPAGEHRPAETAGLGYGPAGAGYGPGPGPGYGSGSSYGPGPGYGPGPSYGAGSGYGPGSGRASSDPIPAAPADGDPQPPPDQGYGPQRNGAPGSGPPRSPFDFTS